MATYMVTSTHTPDECVRGGEEFRKQPRADEILEHTWFGCPYGTHETWTVDEFESETEARDVVPSIFRERARVVRVEVMTLGEAQALHEEELAKH